MRKLWLNANPRVTNTQFAENIIVLLQGWIAQQTISMLNISYEPKEWERTFTQDDIVEINRILNERNAKASLASWFVWGVWVTARPFFTLVRTMESGYKEIPWV